MTIETITNQSAWTAILNGFGSPSFLQSWEWGEVQKHHGYRVERFAIYGDGKPVGLSQTIYIRAKRGNMIFVPHGPLTAPAISPNEKKRVIKVLLDRLTKDAKDKAYHFIRIAPVWEDSTDSRKTFADLGFRMSPIYMHAERVWILDIRKTEDEILKQMRKTTRYSIRRAEKDGVTISDTYNLEQFWEIYEKTAERENFTPFSKRFINHEYDEFNKTGHALFLSGLLPDKSCAASALIVFTESSAFYHQGATTHSRVPVSYLLQWHAIREAKRRGCSFYNFWGTLQPGRTPKNWGGLSLFKQGFGGFERDYVPTQDYVIDPLRYFISFAFETFLKWKRGV